MKNQAHKPHPRSVQPGSDEAAIASDAKRYGVRLTESEAKPDGKGGYLLSASGALKVMLMSPESEIRSEAGRATTRRYKVVARALLAAEQAKVRPREAGKVLCEAFGQAVIMTALREGPAAFAKAVDEGCARIAAQLGLDLL